VGTGFPLRQTPNVCAEIMLKQNKLERDDDFIALGNLM
jgi:hypothetical protein